MAANGRPIPGSSETEKEKLDQQLDNYHAKTEVEELNEELDVYWAEPEPKTDKKNSIEGAAAVTSDISVGDVEPIHSVEQKDAATPSRASVVCPSCTYKVFGYSWNLFVFVY